MYYFGTVKLRRISRLKLEINRKMELKYFCGLSETANN